MARQQNANYQADADTQFEWATDDNDPFDRELDMMRVAVALDEHTHADGRGLPVARLATNAVDSASINSNAVTTAKIADGQITLAKMATGSVNATAIVDGTITNTELAAGVALANLGFTPINKAGDTAVGSLTFDNSKAITIPATSVITGAGYISLSRTTAGATVTLGHSLADTAVMSVQNSGASPGYSLGILNAAASGWDLLLGHTGASFGIPITSAVTTGTAPISVSSTTVCPNVNANYLNGQLGTFYGRATHEVPNGAHCLFWTAGWIPTGWLRESAADGRVLVSAGTSFSSTWAENAQSGSTWSIAHTLSAHTHSVSIGGGSHSHSLTGSAGNIQYTAGGPDARALETAGAGGSGTSGAPSADQTNTIPWAYPVWSSVLAYKNG